MQHYIGLDVSVKETSVCIVDKAGIVMHEVKVAAKPVAILEVLTEEGLAIERIGPEAGPLIEPASIDSTLIINELLHGDARLWSFGSEV